MTLAKVDTTPLKRQKLDTPRFSHRALECKQIVIHILDCLSWKDLREHAYQTCHYWRAVIKELDLKEKPKVIEWFQILGKLRFLNSTPKPIDAYWNGVDALRNLAIAFRSKQTHRCVPFNQARIPSCAYINGDNLFFGLHKTDDSDLYQQFRNHFQHFNAYADGPCLMLRTDNLLQQVPSLLQSPNFVCTRKAIIKLLANNQGVNFLPLAFWFMTDNEFVVFVSTNNLSTLDLKFPIQPHDKIHCVASLLHAVLHLHNLKIVATRAISLLELRLNEHFEIILFDYTALILAEENSESTQALFAADIKSLGLLLLQIFLYEGDLAPLDIEEDHPYNFLTPLFTSMVGELSQTPDISAVVTQFIAQVNQHFTSNGTALSCQDLSTILKTPNLQFR